MERIAINRLAPRMERYMKTNAPWKNRTHMARRTLNARYKRERRGNFYIHLAHGVDYGNLLESMQSGRFAILRPTMNHFFQGVCEELFEGFEEGWK